MDRERGDLQILLLGAHGQVGHELSHVLESLGTVVALDRTGADLSQPESLRIVVRREKPDVIVNAAAYTAVDRAESEPALAESVNAIAPRVLAEEAQSIGASLVHYSTDYVFDGRKSSAYIENDRPNPLSVYGRTKLDGERSVASFCQRHLVFRTSWVFGYYGSNFLKTMLRLAGERDSLRIVADQHGAPTPASLIARVTAHALRRVMHDTTGPSRWGLYHLASRGETTWYGYARHVLDRAYALGFPLKSSRLTIAPISSGEYPTPASRPANSRLDTTKLRSAFSLELPSWTEGVDDVLRRLQPNGKQ